MVVEVCRLVDPKMVEHLSVSILVVALLHVIVDHKLFMLPTDVPFNPKIVCRGKLFKHEDHIPRPTTEVVDF